MWSLIISDSCLGSLGYRLKIWLEITHILCERCNCPCAKAPYHEGVRGDGNRLTFQCSLMSLCKLLPLHRCWGECGVFCESNPPPLTSDQHLFPLHTHLLYRICNKCTCSISTASWMSYAQWRNFMLLFFFSLRYHFNSCVGVLLRSIW
jgi:hypothetical protein